MKENPAPFRERRKQPLRSATLTALDNYFADLDGQKPGNLYDMMIAEVEQALFNAVLEHTNGNQSKASEMLGINRSTLRKKLRLYGLIDQE
jgi:Fis family transcriptional regulator